MVERLNESKIVVYGQVATTSMTGDPNFKRVEHTLNVFCVLKNNGPKQIGDSIIIHTEDPTPECVSNKRWMTQDNFIIVMLEVRDDQFRFNNVNVQSAVIQGDDVNIELIGNTCSPAKSFSGSQCPRKLQNCNGSVSGGSTLCNVTEKLSLMTLMSIVIFLCTQTIL